MRKIWAYLALILLPLSAALAQNDNQDFWQEYMELIAEQNDDESVSEEIMEVLEHFLDNPINLNDTTSHDLQKLFFISEFQTAALKSYIRQNGQMLTVHELEFVNGFDDETRHLLTPFVKVELVPPPEKFSFKNMLRYGKNQITLGYKTTLEKQKGYENGNYLGDPFRTYFRYTFKYKNKVSLSLSGDKDAGEEFFKGSQPQGYDFYGFSLMLNDFGFLKQFIVGNYQLQFGQGLTLWTGAGFNLAGDGTVKKYPQNIRPSGAFTEYGYMQGVATTIGISKHISATAFYSHVKRDGTLVTSENFDTEEDYLQSYYETGYHRTQSELAKKGNITEDLYGAHLQYKSTNLSIGATGYHMTLSSPLQPKPRPDNYSAFSGTENTNFGLDATYLLHRILFFGEMAMDRNFNIAGLAGLQFNATENTLISAYYRNYGVEYQNLYATALGQNSSVQNEEGFGAALRTVLPWQISMVASADIFRFPWLRYQVYSPSEGSDYRVKLSKDLTRRATLSLTYRYKNKAKNTNNIDSLYSTVVEPNKRQNLQLNLKFAPSSEWTFNTRVEHCWFSAESKYDTTGFLISQDVVYNPKKVPFTFAMRYALFETAYDARIYAYERDLTYEFSVPAYNGRGSRFYLFVNWKMSDKINLIARYSIWYYPDKDKISSGNDEIDGNTKQEFKIQFKVKF
ncbi:MAG: hypothetical protein IKQ94_00340 [Bacteroidales bacterium]|nr:hypothetical protein [Bacteroidales bacterium]